MFLIKCPTILNLISLLVSKDIGQLVYHFMFDSIFPILLFPLYPSILVSLLTSYRHQLNSFARVDILEYF